MGNNIYETPRDKAKWKVQNDRQKNQTKNTKEDKNEKLMRLKERLKNQKKIKGTP